MAKFLDPEDPFWAPRWRRYAVVAFCWAWAGVELWQGANLWAGGFAGLGAYAAWVLILRDR
ncbi:hypothetical protein [Jannaschia sp. M317]|uniref:hypothetical protein n=1 Tax=Jannaschia sp. M317 TaxID=2867011 RepID=UPI0021A945DA|nr:hypothetical protein [Jannaschia sp. M317]UWQ16427.1 hypothetical protein K3551_10895 [Jannaschia sp. M317]